MITEETTPNLATLHAEILELKRTVEELRRLILAEKPETDRQARSRQAKREIFTEYDSLLSELAK